MRRAVASVRSVLTSSPRRMDVYFDITDPWSYLTAQIADRLVAAYGVELGFHTITPPASDVNAQPALRTQYALRDAQELTAYYDLEFPGKREADPGMVRDVGTVLVRERPAAEQLAIALALGNALWTNDKKALTELLGKHGAEAHGSVAPILNTKYAELRKAGHYQGAMIHYGGEWYWGVDRLAHLEAALARDLGRPIANVVGVRPEAERAGRPLSKKPLACEMWFSFRSPYSYLALQQIEDVLAPFGVPLVLKQVLPMVSRGVPLPSVKRMYIALDAKREADRLGIPFGELCDPLGPGIAHCLTLQHWANGKGAGLPLARSVTRGIWAEARDVTEYVDLKFLVERAGLPWDEAKHEIEANAEAASKVAADNAAELNGAGLWGVPSFRVGDFVAWGQDRLPLLVDRLRRHQLAAA